jgi:5-formyltetrahydrofolate cyclo-ligase
MQKHAKQQLRKTYRQRRNLLNQEQQAEASQQLVYILSKAMEIHNVTPKVIACYLCQDGEVDLTPFIQSCWDQQIQICLPILHPFSKGHLLFVNYVPESKMRPNKYGILEPQLSVIETRQLKDIDVICTPLVAFNHKGNRLGMGGGYYDRTLSTCMKNTQRPSLIGIAHDCQESQTLPSESWDIPMDMIVTPTRLITLIP